MMKMSKIHHCTNDIFSQTLYHFCVQNNVIIVMQYKVLIFKYFFVCLLQLIQISSILKLFHISKIINCSRKYSCSVCDLKLLICTIFLLFVHLNNSKCRKLQFYVKFRTNCGISKEFNDGTKDQRQRRCTDTG